MWFARLAHGKNTKRSEADVTSLDDRRISAVFAPTHGVISDLQHHVAQNRGSFTQLAMGQCQCGCASVHARSINGTVTNGTRAGALIDVPTSVCLSRCR